MGSDNAFSRFVASLRHRIHPYASRNCRRSTEIVLLDPDRMFAQFLMAGTERCLFRLQAARKINTTLSSMN
jgi:hypothetical protein